VRVTIGAPSSDIWLDFGRALVVDHVSRRAATGDVERIDVDVRGEVRRRFRESLAEPGTFSIVCANARFDVEAAEVLAVALACELDPALARLLVSSDPGRGRLTIGSLMEMLAPLPPDVVARTIGQDGPLARAGLVEVTIDGAFVDHVVGVHPAVVWAVLGDESLDPDLPLDADHIDRDIDIDGDADDDGDDSSAEYPLIVVSGGDRMLRRRHAARRCAGDRFLVVPAPATDAGWAAVVRDATITGRGVIVELSGPLPEVGRRWIERAVHLVWAVSSPSEPSVVELPRRPWTEVQVSPREVTDREWRSVLGDTERTHRLTHEQLATVGRVFPAVGHDLDAAVRRLVSGRMEHLARRIRPTRGWDDIVLSPDRTELLQSLVDRYRYADQVYDDWGFSASPSRGLVALFSGPSGTGKTMATEIIAGVLGLDVFKLDLSSVVSKYIGETEKNLEQIFDAASAGNMVLFFDEADALFGKRSEVKDARDRYANIEVSYLLQRLERYDGLVVLATNFEKNVDDAFVRRIHVRIEFAMPGVDERRAIWASNLPPRAPVDGVDLDDLAARFELSGGSIKNAAVHAAFLAAAAGQSITMETAVRGVARELRKMGRLLKANDFGEFYPAVVTEVDASVTGAPTVSRRG
jgi:AAA+ superfamily predicted ATPase